MKTNKKGTSTTKVIATIVCLMIIGAFFWGTVFGILKYEKEDKARSEAALNIIFQHEGYTVIVLQTDGSRGPEIQVRDGENLIYATTSLEGRSSKIWTQDFTLFSREFCHKTSPLYDYLSEDFFDNLRTIAYEKKAEKSYSQN